VRPIAVDVILRWGDQVVRVERWTGEGPLPEGLDLRLDARGWPCVSGTPLEMGAPVEVALGDGMAPYRSDHRTALVARVELVAARGARRSLPGRRHTAAVLGALALHGVLALSAFARPALRSDEMTMIDREFLYARPTRVLYAAPVPTDADTRERQTDDDACADPWDCLDHGGSPPGPFAAIGLVPGRQGCVAARRVHVVEPGETLTSIAALYGIADFRAIYNEVVNEDLLRLRPDPNVIFPGDEVRIPGEDLCATL
jgi:hypothetical protein